MNTEISHDVIEAISACKPHVVEALLTILREKIDIYLANQRRPQGRRHVDDMPEADQDNRGYIPSAEGFYQDGQSGPQTRSLINPEYVGADSNAYYSPQNRNGPPGGPPDISLGGNQEMLPKSRLDERNKAIESSAQTIQMLNSKIQRLEQLLGMKDMRIEDLTRKLEQLSMPAFTQPPQVRAGRQMVGKRQPIGRF